MKTILVPIDFSDIAENAMNYAAELAKYSQAKLVLLNTYSLPMPMVNEPFPELQFNEIDRINKEQLRSIDAKLKAVYGGIETELITTIGFVIEDILLYAQEKQADAIVLGVSEPDKQSFFLSNSVASIIKEAPCPVLTIPEKARFKKPTRIALACDYSSIMPEKVINDLKSIVKLFNAKVLVFDVLKTAEVVTYEKAVAEENLEESLSDVDHTLHFPSGDNLIEEINTFVDRHVVDMLVMMPHKHNFFSSLFHRSNTKQMALNAHIPLLTIHE